MSDDRDNLFVFHWQTDGSLKIIHCGKSASALLGGDLWAENLGELDDIFQQLLLAEISKIQATGAYRSGTHEIESHIIGATVRLRFTAVDSGDNGVFWRGHISDASGPMSLEDNADEVAVLNPALQWLALADTVDDMVSFKRPDGVFLYTNPSFDAFHKLKSGDAVGKTDEELFGVERAKYTSLEDQAALATGKRSQCMETRYAPDKGEVVTLNVRRVPLMASNGLPLGLFSAARDLSRRHRLEREMATDLHRCRQMLSETDDFIVHFNAAGQPTFMNQRLLQEYDLTPEVFPSLNLLTDEFVQGADKKFLKGFLHVVESGEPIEIVEDIRTHSGAWSRERIRLSPEMDGHGKVIGVFAIGRTVNEPLSADVQLKNERRKLSRLQKQFDTVLKASDDAIWLKDNTGTFVACNNAFEKLIGLIPSQILGQKVLLGRSEFPVQLVGSEDLTVLQNGRSIHTEALIRPPGSDAITNLKISISPYFDEDGQFAGSIGMARDTSRERQAELELMSSRRHLSELAYSDDVTGLPNERHARNKIGTTLQESHSGKDDHAILLVNIDRFEKFSDASSQSNGDLLLKRLAERIRHAAVRSYVARLSGDEFLIQVRIANETEAEQLAENVLAAIAKPFFIESRYFTVSACIGIALLPGLASSTDDLLTQAGLAMRQAKFRGPGGYSTFDSRMIDAARDRFSLETDIRMGLEKGQFETHYQPKVDLATNEITGAEALMRWKHPRRGNIPPAIFIPLAEETGLILPLGERILTEACRFSREWNERSDRTVTVSVNLSARQVMCERFASVLKQILEQTGCRPEWLELELTENLLISDQRRVSALLDDVAALGVRISVDDFGTGYSALSNLINYPIDSIKIDRSLIREVTKNSRQSVLVRSIIDLARGLELNVVAEGVESRSEEKWLLQAGCQLGQGFLWSRAISKMAFFEWAQIFRNEDEAAE